MIPSTVREVSAILVDTMHLRVPSGALSKIFACRSDGSVEYMGRIIRGGDIVAQMIQALLEGEAGGLDLLLARHEDEHVSRRVSEMHCHRLLDGGVDIVLLRGLGEQDVHRERSSGNLEDRRASRRRLQTCPSPTWPM